MTNYKFEFVKEIIEETGEVKYLEIHTRILASREYFIRKFGKDPEECV